MDDSSETPLVKKPKKTDNKNNNTHDMNDDNENNDNSNNNDDNIHTQNNNKNENNSSQHLSSQTELDSDFTLADVVVTHKQNKEITLQQIIDRVYV